MRELRPVYLFDTVTLSNFVLAGRFELLVDRYGKRLQVTPAVLEEVAEGVIAGYGSLHEIERAVDEGRIGETGGLASTEDRKTCRELLRILAPGEAACIVHAEACGGVVVSDDRTARQCCEARGIKVTGTIGILKALTLEQTLSPEEADSVLQDMIDAGYYSPVRSISGLV